MKLYFIYIDSVKTFVAYIGSISLIALCKSKDTYALIVPAPTVFLNDLLCFTISDGLA